MTSFKNVPEVSTTTQADYVLGSGAQALPFEIRYEPQSCDYLKSYSVFVDGVKSSPSWLSIDESQTPHRVVIETSHAADKGYYTVEILC